MERLPNEILHNIFLRVPFKWRLECMLVSRHWCSSLRRLCDIEIHGMDSYFKFMRMLQQQPNRGDLVEMFYLEVEDTCEFDYAALFTMLPNLRDINIQKYEYSYSEEEFEYETLKLENTSSKLEVIKDTVDCELIRRLMVSNVCTRLRSLNIETFEIQNLGEEIFIYLKNAPALEDLTLSCYIGIRDLEILHKNVPSLQNLYLKNIWLNAGELPHNITPATSVQSFSINTSTIADYATYPNWYKYFAKKYTNLLDFKLKDEIFRDVYGNSMIKIYRDGIIPLYGNIRNLPDTFKAINVPTEVNIFKRFSELGLRFKSFYLSYNDYRPIFTQLAESDQSKYTKHIALASTIIPSPIMLQNFTSLESLKIGSDRDRYYWDIDLSDYFDVFPPTLTSFKAYLGDAKISEFPTCTNNIEEFLLDCETIYPELGEVISYCFTKLINLNLNGRVTENLKIDLPNNNLKKLCITTTFYTDLSNGFSITTTATPPTKYYIGKKENGKNSKLITVPAEEEDLHNRVNINMKYKTVDKLILNNTDIDNKYH